MSKIKIDPTIYKTSPQPEGRLKKETRVYELLEKLEISFERLDHEIANTIQECEEIEQILDIPIYKNLFLCNKQQTHFYLLMMPGYKGFKSGEISKQLNSSRLSFAPQEFMEEFLDITPGSVSILGLMNDTNHKVKFVVDEDLLRDEYVGCHPCINTSSLKIKTKDLIERFLPYTGHEVVYVKIEE